MIGCGRARVPAPPPAPPSPCAPAGRWINPRTGFAVAMPDVVAPAAGSPVVLLGEDHDRRAHHRWQLHVVAAIAGRARDVTLGFEMFARRVQPALDRWVSDGTDEDAFLTEVGWKQGWGGDPGLYWPLFHFARMHRVRMLALNVDRSLVRGVATAGWDGVPAADREGLSTPAPAGPAYRARLAEAWRAHGPAGSAADPAALDRFVEAQLVWDRAMAEGIAAALARRPDSVVVALMGRGHIESGDGVPAQLAALGVPRPLVMIPWEPARDCSELVPGVADFVFGVDATRSPR
jgi:uncharacterized iron-regulated protein